MFVNTVIRRCLLPAAALITEAKLNSSEEAEVTANTCRPSELPIYTPEPPTIITQDLEGTQNEEALNLIENSIRSVRQTWAKYSEEMVAYERVAKQSFNESKQNVKWLIDYLQQEDNTFPKAGAIGIGALTGFVFGLRGKLFKRTIYATTGALGMAAVCYPKEASEYAQLGLGEGKKYLTIAYNFVYGVKKEDPPLELPSLPKLPTSLSEAWDSVKSGASSFFSDDSSKQNVETVQNTRTELKK